MSEEASEKILARLFRKKDFDVILTETNTFRQYSGTDAHVAGLFDGRIHLPVKESVNSEKELKSILWHEYTHALIWYISRGKCPRWLSEGFAVYEEEKINPKRRAKLKEVVESGHLIIPINSLDTIFSRADQGNISQLVQAYNEAYAIVSYLHSRYKKATIRKFLKSLPQATSLEQAIKTHFHISLDKLEKRVVSHIQ